MILAGDIGGTKTTLAFFQAEGGRTRPLVEATNVHREYANLDEIVSQFMSAHTLPFTHACFGVAELFTALMSSPVVAGAPVQ